MAQLWTCLICLSYASFPHTNPQHECVNLDNNMATVQNAAGPREFGVRTLRTQERQDQRDVSRVFLTAEALMTLGLNPGERCRLYKVDETYGHRPEAIAWTALQKPLNNNIVQMYKTFQTYCGFSSEDKINIAPTGAVLVALSVTVTEVISDDEEAKIALPLSEMDRPHWEWFLKECLGRKFSC